MEKRRRLIGFILTRIILVTLLLVATLILKIQSPGSIEGWDFPRFLLLLTSAYLFSLVSIVVSWLNARLRPALAYFQIVWDIFFVMLLLVVTGGIESPFSFLYLLSIINASVLLARREALYTASLCGILYGALLDFQYYGLLAPLGLSREEAGRYGAVYIFYTIFVTITAYYLAAFLSGYLAERARRSELELKEYKAEMEAGLKRADRLAAVGELSARIAHEIRNPLASISGSVQLIAQNHNLQGEERQLLQIVVRESDRLNALISDFLAYARPQSPRRLPVPFCRIIDDLRVLMLSDQRFQRIVVRQEFAGATTLWVDVNQLTQVLWNLFANAADAMPGGGEITVGVLPSAGGEEGGEGTSWDELTISDTGTGMTSQELASIFEPFFTTKRAGSGLGLATVYRIVEGHGGQVRVESDPGMGTRFTIRLPKNGAE